LNKELIGGKTTFCDDEDIQMQRRKREKVEKEQKGKKRKGLKKVIKNRIPGFLTFYFLLF
jgi:hypothetical protein